MVDRELSRAVEAYLRGLWPYERQDGVIALGDDSAKRLLPRLKQLANEAFHWPSIRCGTMMSRLPGSLKRVSLSRTQSWIEMPFVR
jgi:hypothetical protein